MTDAKHTPGSSEHLTTCYEEDTGSHANPMVFWVCGRNCPVTNPPKTHSPTFTGTFVRYQVRAPRHCAHVQAL